MAKKCSLWFCDQDIYAKGYCNSHYLNWYRYGTPIAPSNRDLQGAMVFAETMAQAYQEGDVKRLSELSVFVIETADQLRREIPMKAV